MVTLFGITAKMGAGRNEGEQARGAAGRIARFGEQVLTIADPHQQRFKLERRDTPATLVRATAKDMLGGQFDFACDLFDGIGHSVDNRVEQSA